MTVFLANAYPNSQLRYEKQSLPGVGGVEPLEFDDFEFSRLSIFEEDVVGLKHNNANYCFQVDNNVTEYQKLLVDWAIIAGCNFAIILDSFNCFFYMSGFIHDGQPIQRL